MQIEFWQTRLERLERGLSDLNIDVNIGIMTTFVSFGTILLLLSSLEPLVFRTLQHAAVSMVFGMRCSANSQCSDCSVPTPHCGPGGTCVEDGFVSSLRRDESVFDAPASRAVIS